MEAYPSPQPLHAGSTDRWTGAVRALAVALALTPAALVAADAPRPNILLLLSDDLGPGDVGCYNPESKIATPHLDRLAAEGLRFTDAHTPSALCAPTRYSMLTGNYPWRGREPQGTWVYHGSTQFLPGQKTVGHLLQAAGYRTALLGKSNVGGIFAAQADGAIDWTRPMIDGAPQWGFDSSCVLLTGHQGPPYAWIEDGRLAGDPARMTLLPKGPLNGGHIEAAGVGLPDWDSRQVGATLLEKAATFLDDHLTQNRAAGRNQPFYIHLSTDGGHSPFTPPDEIGGVPVKGATGIAPQADMVHQVDVLLGHLRRMLEERGLLENTLIVFASDNGGMPRLREFGHDAVAGFRSGKMSIYEGGHRVPLIVWWGGTSAPGRLKPGAVSHQLVGTQDLVATFVELAGGMLPGDQALDAVSLGPIVTGRQPEDRPLRDQLLLQSGRVINDTIAPIAASRRHLSKPGDAGDGSIPLAFALRSGPWKLVIDSDGESVALYHLGEDPAETSNRIDQPDQAVRVREMRADYEAIRRSTRSTPATAVTL